MDRRAERGEINALDGVSFLRRDDYLRIDAPPADPLYISKAWIEQIVKMYGPKPELEPPGAAVWEADGDVLQVRTPYRDGDPEAVLHLEISEVELIVRAYNDRFMGLKPPEADRLKPPHGVRWPEARKNVLEETDRTAPRYQAGCICPPTAEQTCRAPACPRGGPPKKWGGL